MAGVSRTTVSLVMNNAPGARLSDETRQRVLQAARELGYYPKAAARSLATGKTQRIGLVLGEGLERLAADAFLPVFLQGLTISAHQQGYLVVVQLAEDTTDQEEYIWLIREQQVDGLILSGPSLNSPMLPKLAEERFPLILHGRLKDSGFTYIDVDNSKGAHTAVRHLIELGHRRIGFISNAHFSFSGTQERFAGYTQALAEQDIAYNSDLVRVASFLPESGKTAMEQMLRLPKRPTAVFAASDVIAFGAMRAIHAAGLRIPQDVAVVGFDDIFLSAHAQPPLTTVRVPAHEMGWTAAELLVPLIEGDEAAQSVTLETELVMRDSCGAKTGRGERR
jgi:LacI family transcriptional regulator